MRKGRPLELQYYYKVTGSPIPDIYPPCLTGAMDGLPETNVHHDSGTGDDQVLDKYGHNAWGGGPSYDVGGRRTVRGSVQEVEDVYLDPSTLDQFLSACLVKGTHCSLS